MKRKNPEQVTRSYNKISKAFFYLGEVKEQLESIELEIEAKDKRIRELQARIEDMDYTLRQFDLEPCQICTNYVAEEDVIGCETCGVRGCITGNKCCKHGVCPECEK